jgi:hypothetical protein
VVVVYEEVWTARVPLAQVEQGWMVHFEQVEQVHSAQHEMARLGQVY